MNEPASIRITPPELAQQLFSLLVLDDEDRVMATHDERFWETPGFQQHRYDRQKFVYLAANVAIALTNAAGKDSRFIDVIQFFRGLVALEMHKRWGDAEGSVDTTIETAATDYAALLFTDPEQNRGLSFDWSREWLRRIGIEEYDPAVLFAVSQTWRIYHLNVAKLLSRAEIVV